MSDIYTFKNDNSWAFDIKISQMFIQVDDYKVIYVFITLHCN